VNRAPSGFPEDTLHSPERRDSCPQICTFSQIFCHSYCHFKIFCYPCNRVQIEVVNVSGNRSLFVYQGLAFLLLHF
jgi:hypothetical protein